MSLFDLPETLLLPLTELLLGVDLFWLSHASSYTLQLLSEDRFWSPRLPVSSGSNEARPRSWLRHWTSRKPMTDINSAKWVYMHQYSLKFQGSTLEGQPSYGPKWRALTVVSRNASHVPMRWQGHFGAISYDLGFSLAPDEPGCVQGGILLGGQLDAFGVRDRGPHNYLASAIIDTQGNLYCSILNAHKSPIATNLQSERWYHLALTWGNDLQRVYLDNELVSEEEGFLHFEWRRQSHWQIGGGGISGGSVGKPTEDWDGWLGFRGIIDDFRIWTQPLSSEQIQQLGRQEDLGEGFEPVFSMKQLSSRRQHAERVRCSRPFERICRPFTKATTL